MSKGVSIEHGGKWEDAVLLVDVNFKTLDDVFRTVSLGKKATFTSSTIPLATLCIIHSSSLFILA